MKGKVADFLFVFVGFGILSLISYDWSLTGRQIAEIFFIGTLVGLASALTKEPLTRFIFNTVRKMKI